MPDYGMEARGLVETQRKVEQVVADLRGRPFLQAMRDATLVVERDARILAPVDVGRLRASITSEVRIPEDGLVTGVVGSAVAYAAAAELGSRPHWPPMSTIEVWAKRHGINAFLVARAISQRGTPARRYLQGAFDKNKPRIVRIIGDTVSEIVTK